MAEEYDQRIQVLEEKFEYQEQIIDALNEVVIAQQTQIDALEDQFTRLQELLTTAQDAGPSGDIEPKPPHY